MTYYQSREEIDIESSPEKIYRALIDWEVRSCWRLGLKMKWEGESKAFVGQEIHFEVEGTFPPAKFNYRIAGLEPPRRIFMDYIGNLMGRAAIEITPLEKGCRVSFYWMKVEPKGLGEKIYFGLGFGLASHKRRTTQTLEMLKSYLEKSGS